MSTKKKSAKKVSLRSEKELDALIDKASAEYNEVANELPVVKLRPYTDKIKALKQERSDVLSKGAKVCPGCGTDPHGMRKNEHTIEIGCLACTPFEKDGFMISYSARDVTPELAAKKWNDGDWVMKPIQ